MQLLGIDFISKHQDLQIHVVVQCYPWFKFYFPLFKTHYPTLPYPKTNEDKI